MIVRKFTAPSTREALQLARNALGAEALILSNRSNNGMVEIMAMAESDMAALTQKEPDTPTLAIRHDIPGLRTLRKPTTQGDPVPPPVEAAPRDARVGAAAAADPSPPAVASLAEEVKSIRSLLENQLVQLAWRDMRDNDPAQFDMLRTLLGLSFSPRLSRELSRALPRDLGAERAAQWIRAALARNLRCAGADDDLIARGGVVALVGPTGVGKTTTVAKLAARCVLQKGAQSLALITTDSYRIGAHEQLKIYGKILNVPVYAVKDADDLARTIADLQSRHMVLIDTVGMSQRDRRVSEQIALLSRRGLDIKRLLLLAATSHPGTLDDVVRAYHGDGLAGVVLTKLDESLGLAPVLDVVIRHKLTAHFVTNGQRVPEDLHRANALYLVDRALKHTASANHLPRDEEFPILIGAREDDAHDFLAPVPPL